MKVQAETKEAAASIRAKRSARTQNYISESYPKDNRLSILKLRLGEILLCLQRPLNQNERRIYWQDLESMLREYIDVKSSPLRANQIGSQDTVYQQLNGAESTNSGQRVGR